jgi:hypothetical protein
MRESKRCAPNAWRSWDCQSDHVEEELLGWLAIAKANATHV